MKKIKVLFIYPESGYNTYNNISFKNGRYYHGIGILSAVIKKMGCITSLHHILNEFNAEKLNKKIIDFNPDLICTSSTTHMMMD
ncbi:MAG: hypothetical protein M0Q02_08235, partial [Candidatus Muirbacterium halophilum]|nr:hypothetical protein [Candidatus Muirbacterium halophilum]